VKILLDENLPLGFIHSLRADGLSADHIITLGLRGTPDARIRELLADDQILFLTQDEEFLFGASVTAILMLSRVRQSRPLKERIEVWRKAVHELIASNRPERLFELMDDGTILPWRDV
jgi:hypothetical protein